MEERSPIPQAGGFGRPEFSMESLTAFGPAAATAEHSTWRPLVTELMDMLGKPSYDGDIDVLVCGRAASTDRR